MNTEKDKHADRDSRHEELRQGYAQALPQKIEELRVAMLLAAMSSSTSPETEHALELARQLTNIADAYNFSAIAGLAVKCVSVLAAYQSITHEAPDWSGVAAEFQNLSLDLEGVDLLEPAAEKRSVKKGHILVVDEDDDSLSSNSRMLSDAGYTPVPVVTPEDVETFIDLSQPDLILLDAEMAGRNAFNLSQQLKSHKLYKDIPIIFLMKRNTPDERIAALNAGGDDFIIKPVIAEELLTRVDTQVDKARHLQERERLLSRAESHRDSLLALLDQLQIGTLLINADGEVDFINHYCASIGIAPAEGIHQHWEDALPLDSASKKRFAEQLAMPLMEREELLFNWTKQGQQVFVTCQISHVSGELNQQIVCLSDVTNLHHMQQQLEASRYGQMIGSSAPMRDLYNLIEQVARGDWTVLIEGETGTGKELVAHSIHAASPRSEGPFIAVNAAGLSESLLSSQLFGHRKGAFTGAYSDQAGFFESASGGTLFLDEIGDLPMAMQASLLRVLQEKEITRIGETQSRKVDVRILAASHKDLSVEVEAGHFREDLLFRLRVARLLVPGLRERKTDIPLLTELFMSQHQADTDEVKRSFSTDAMQALLDYDWPGNVRELKSAIDFALIHSRGELVSIQDLPPEIRRAEAASFSLSISAVEETSLLIKGDDERTRILSALQQTGGNRAKAARLLGMSRATLYRRLDNLNLSDTD